MARSACDPHRRCRPETGRAPLPLSHRRAFVARHTRLRPVEACRASASISPTTSSRSGARPRRRPASTARRSRSGRSPGRAGSRWRATSRSTRTTVAGREVLDMATGSGLVALVAARAGAAHVDAADIDPFAEAAVAHERPREPRSTSRSSRRDLLDDAPPAVDVLLAADTWYEGPLADRILPWLRAAADAGIRVLVGDPGRAYLPDPAEAGFERLARYDVRTTTTARGSRGRGRVRVPRAPGRPSRPLGWRPDAIDPQPEVARARPRPDARRAARWLPAVPLDPLPAGARAVPAARASAASVPATMLIGCSDSTVRPRGGVRLAARRAVRRAQRRRARPGVRARHPQPRGERRPRVRRPRARRDLDRRMGHGRCGGVAAALGDGAPLSSTDFIGVLDAGPARSRRGPRARRLDGPGAGPPRARARSVEQSLVNLETFPWIRSRERAGTLRLAGCWYDIALGELHQLSPDGWHPVP